jgi:hypothetical protein
MFVSELTGYTLGSEILRQALAGLSTQQVDTGESSSVRIDVLANLAQILWNEHDPSA